MHQVTVTMAHIERAERGAVKWQKYLHLTFRTETGSRQWWEVPGWPTVELGMTVTALLSRPIEPNRSNRVLGWKCHQTGEVVDGQSSARFAVGALAFAVAGALALRLYSLSPELSSLTTPIPGVVFLILAAALLAGLVRAMRVRSKLRAFIASSVASTPANPSIEGAASSGLRPPPAAPHVKR